jgi:hypothetical protein
MQKKSSCVWRLNDAKQRIDGLRLLGENRWLRAV